MTEEQWRAAWVLCETAGDLDTQAQREYVRGATVDPEVERQVLAVLEELESEAVAYPPVPDRRRGDTVGRYTLGERIGQGGMGEVYATEDTELRRTVALKFLPNAVVPDRAAAVHVISEARFASSLNHPHIVTIHELIQTPWGLAMVMERVEGQSLRALLKARPLSSRQTIQIGRQIASALAAAHEKGIVHRDIKPENIMLRVDGYVKVLDFGLAQNLREHALSQKGAHLPMGTVRYMSPEQMAGQAVTAASDIYSLALVLKEAGWKHPILTRMGSLDPLRRPPAREVEQRLAKLENTALHQRLVWILLFGLLLVFTGFYWLHRPNEPAPPRLEPITHYSSGHDITAAAVSRSGDQLAYATIDGGFFLRDNRTHQVRELTGPEHLTCYQLWFTNGPHLLALNFADGTFEAWQIPLGAGNPRRLASDVQLAALSHDGKQVAWLNGAHQIWRGASLDPSQAHLLQQVPRGTRVAALFWSGDDRQLWVHRLSGCRDDAQQPDVAVNPDLCETSDLVRVESMVGPVPVSSGPLRFNSGLFTASGEFLCLRQDFAGRAEGFNLWSLRLPSTAGQRLSHAQQISHLTKAALWDLTGTADGQTLFWVRSDNSAQIYTADWQRQPTPSLQRPLRLTFEQSYNFPHAWSPDSRSVLFESDRHGHSEIFRQNRRRREPELLVSSERENYHPQWSPDGRWILFMSARNTPDAGFTDFRLMRVPAGGGPISEIPIGEPLDEYRCSMPGQGHICVLRTTHEGHQFYYELDPVQGKGRELGRTNFAITGLGRWALSANGRSVAIPDPTQPGRFTELQLDPDPSQRRQILQYVSGLDSILAGMNPGPVAGEWLVWTDPNSRTADPLALPPFSLDPSRFSTLYFVDAHRQAHLLQNDSLHAYALFSPDGKQVAAIRDELTSNVWSFTRGTGAQKKF